MSGFGHLKRCSDVTEADANAACASREDFDALLARLVEIAAPDTGAPTIFMVLGRLAASCDWIECEVAAEIASNEEASDVRILAELGAGMREVLFSFELAVPLAELGAALERDPAAAAPLRVHRRTWKRITLGEAPPPSRRSTRPPRISDDSLVVDLPPSSQRLPPPPSKKDP